MMGKQSHNQQKLFHYTVRLEQRIPQKHQLRQIREMIDFDFVYHEVKDCYGYNGNVSIPPPIILKMMLLLVVYNVRSERELMDTIPFRLDWLWFLGYDLEDEIPNHSVLSKARTRWGVHTFKSFFERVVWQCVESGLVEGSKLFMDASLIDANASNNSVVDKKQLKRHLNESYQVFEERLDEGADEKTTPANSRYVSKTDPDAAVTRQGSGRSKLRYKTHRGVDARCEVITTTSVTAGSRDDGALFEEIIESHEHNTHKSVTTAVADSKYGTIDNFLASYDRGIKAHMPSIEETHRGSGRRKDIFSKEDFTYNPDDDTFTCPAGNILKRKNYSKERQHYEYRASSKVCACCQVRADCTRAKNGRTLKRHRRQHAVDSMLSIAHGHDAKRDLKTRMHLSERSFAHAGRYGDKRARWRRLWRMEIQEFLIAAIQNIQILIKHMKPRVESAVRTLGNHTRLIKGMQRISGFISRTTSHLCNTPGLNHSQSF